MSLTLVAGESARAAQDDVILGKPSTIRPRPQTGETVDLAAGARLRQAPSFTAPILEILGTALELPVVDRQGDWVRVRYGTWFAWIHPADAKVKGPAPSFVPDEERLRRARSLLGAAVTPQSLGPYTLYTDLEDPSLLDWLTAIAWDVLRAYEERFALDPGVPVDEVVIVFAHEADYRAFEAAEARIAGTDSRGYTTEGLSVLFVGALRRDDIASVFIHELTHLLNRRVFRSTLPPWLEEGLAEDLAFCQVTGRGILRLGTLAGASPRGIEDTTTVSGPKAQLAALLRSWDGGRQPDLAELMATDWSDFVQPHRRAIHYTASAMFLRYLSDGGDKELGRAFRSFLRDAAVAEAGPIGAPWGALGIEPGPASAGLYKFVLQQAGANGIR